ncbi:MAG: type 4a pilus biogenesis protein PilO [Nitrococcus sp.]|nr:type 4a pilus biogenesis protein PilO [Nitrococcus sp.]
MNLAELRELDFEQPGRWPLLVKVAAMVILFSLMLGAGWYFDWQHQWDQLDQARAREIELKGQFEQKQRLAANLAAYQKQLEDMRASFGAMLRQLPSRAEVAKLLVDISHTGLASGLEFELFKPLDSIRKEFYAELPVAIEVRGTYQEFAHFVSDVANLPRIVTLHNIRIRRDGAANAKPGRNADTPLRMALSAKTYWYLEGGAN